jgi:hypothetical protein
MERIKPAINVAVVLALAAAIDLLPGGGRAASTFEALLYVAFGVGIAYFGMRVYRENRIALYGLGQRHRASLYGAPALILFVVVAQKRMWQTGLGELAWFVLVGFAGYGLLAVYRHSRTY